LRQSSQQLALVLHQASHMVEEALEVPVVGVLQWLEGLRRVEELQEELQNLGNLRVDEGLEELVCCALEAQVHCEHVLGCTPSITSEDHP
jgi:hypothetical protein